MTKVYIDWDSTRVFFLWDGEVLDILPQDERNLVEVPDDLVAKYNFVCSMHNQLQEELRTHYEARIANSKITGSTG